MVALGTVSKRGGVNNAESSKLHLDRELLRGSINHSPPPLPALTSRFQLKSRTIALIGSVQVQLHEGTYATEMIKDKAKAFDVLSLIDGDSYNNT